jgi:ABC-type phosphate transport system substrate-binding protein
VVYRLALTLSSRMMFLILLGLVATLSKCNGEIIYLNGTGGSFPQNLYQQAAFAYQFVQNVSFSYHGDGSGVGQCNAM